MGNITVPAKLSDVAYGSGFAVVDIFTLAKVSSVGLTLVEAEKEQNNGSLFNLKRCFSFSLFNK